MRTVITQQYGGPEVLEIVDVETPDPEAGEVRIAVTAAVSTPSTSLARAGALRPIIGEPFPLGFGWDVSGIVDAVGSDVDHLAVGDAVVGLRDVFSGPTGTYASHVVLPATAVVPAPSDVDPVLAASFPLNTLTADQAIDLLGLEPGLVRGRHRRGGRARRLPRPAGIAARRGLRVIAVARAEDEEDVRAAGAATSSPAASTWRAPYAR